MPDGNEEREELRTRLEEQTRENSETWIDREDEGHRVIVRDLPMREHIDTPVREQMIVELYSK